MDITQLLLSALYGLVEGITEWLPISSTGHMLLLDELVVLDVSSEFWDMFLVVIQLGAILAVCLLYVRRLNPFALSKSAEDKRATWTLWGKIIVACIPAAVVGIPLDDLIEEHFYTAPVIAAALVVYGLLFIVIERWYLADATQMRGAHFSPSAQHTGQAIPRAHVGAASNVSRAEDIPLRTALGIGLFQVLALIPGTSRSGSTIIGGLLLGTTRKVAAEFTFFLAIPVMFGASALRLGKYLMLDGGVFGATELQILCVGCLVAFAVSLLAIRWLTSFVRSHTFTAFGVYRIVLGGLVMGYYLLS